MYPSTWIGYLPCLPPSLASPAHGCEGEHAMPRYRYAQHLDPPAPFVHVTVRNPTTAQEVADLPAQVDSGADITVLPSAVVGQLALVPVRTIRAAGVGTGVILVTTYLVEVAVRGLRFVTVEAAAHPDEPHVLVGRDVLNH